MIFFLLGRTAAQMSAEDRIAVKTLGSVYLF